MELRGLELRQKIKQSDERLSTKRTGPMRERNPKNPLNSIKYNKKLKEIDEKRERRRWGRV